MNIASRTVFKNNELLRHLDIAGIDRVAAHAVRRRYDHGAAIFTAGDPADGIYGVIAGQVQISAWTCNHDEIILQSYGSGRIFGMISAIDGQPRCATARVAPSAEVFLIPRDHFLRLLAADPLLSISLIAALCLAQRLSAQMIVNEYSQRRVPARLAHRILELTERSASGRHAAEASLEITQSDLAKFVFASRQVVNHYLREWEGRGWISMSRGRLSVIDRLALVRMATNGVEPLGAGGALREDAGAGELAAASQLFISPGRPPVDKTSPAPGTVPSASRLR